ncbi:Syntaxin-8 [Myotis brandtii]|uniref:Syntaxin-8 n=1 Tax=Myotis brandtii TaxID=109478 RepID=S7NDU9_MYOBR|nr:Syntaxin-8 [Myotis brandtii]
MTKEREALAGSEEEAGKEPVPSASSGPPAPAPGARAGVAKGVPLRPPKPERVPEALLGVLEFPANCPYGCQSASWFPVVIAPPFCNLTHASVSSLLSIQMDAILTLLCARVSGFSILKIIDDLANLVENTDERLRTETRRVTLVDRKSASCGERGCS